MLIPRYPGVLCAFGLLVSDVVLDYSQYVLAPVTEDTFAVLQNYLDQMIMQAGFDLSREGLPSEAMTFISSVDMRYQGQAYELTIPISADLVADFHAVHANTYGYSMLKRPVEVVNLRLQAIGAIEKPILTPDEITENDGSAVRVGEVSAPGGDIDGAVRARPIAARRAVRRQRQRCVDLSDG